MKTATIKKRLPEDEDEYENVRINIRENLFYTPQRIN